MVYIQNLDLMYIVFSGVPMTDWSMLELCIFDHQCESYN